MEFPLGNIFEIFVGIGVTLFIIRAFAKHKTIDQRMEETINDPNFDPMSYHERKQAEREQKAAKKAETDE